MTHPAPDSLVPYAFGAADPALARHVADCATCQLEVNALREAAGLVRGQVSLERRTESADCLDELVIADFVEGRLSPDTRAPVVAHLLTCARCRSVVRATGSLVADTNVAPDVPHGWRRWSLPLGVAAAAALLFVLWPRSVDDGSQPGMREPPLGSTVAPSPIAPRGSVAQLERLVWSSVPHAEQYRVRLYNGEGSVLWTLETTDTSAVLADSIALSPLVTYFWKVEAQTEWRRWAASDLVEFRLIGYPP